MKEDKEKAIKEMIYMLNKHCHFEEDEFGPEVLEELLDERNHLKKELQEEKRRWFEYAESGHCGLCANTGIVNTLRSAVFPNRGLHVGVEAYCLCPNGRAMKGSQPTVLKWIFDDGRIPQREPICNGIPKGKRVYLEDIRNNDGLKND